MQILYCQYNWELNHIFKINVKINALCERYLLSVHVSSSHAHIFSHNINIIILRYLSWLLSQNCFWETMFILGSPLFLILSWHFVLISYFWLYYFIMCWESKRKTQCGHSCRNTHLLTHNYCSTITVTKSWVDDEHLFFNSIKLFFFQIIWTTIKEHVTRVYFRL